MRRAWLAGVLVFVGAACEGTTGPNVYLRTPGGGQDAIDGVLEPGSMRLRPTICDGEVLTPEFSPLTEDDLASYLEKHGFRTRKSRARRDLVYIDVLDAGQDYVRLRVAILDQAPAAGRELHEAILQHGPGSWGVHRSNLAVLAPIGSPDQIIGFAVKSKLACWGVLTLAGLDDTFVVPGGYMEL